ncbi:Two-component system response regulator [Azospirillaceae bacterium]
MQNSFQIPLIAVLDENKARRHEVSNSLSSLYRVIEYSDYQWAVLGIRASRPNIILVDQDALPNQRAESIDDLRGDIATSSIPVILTAKSFDSSMTFSSPGRIIPLLRPYRRSALIKAVTSVLNSLVEQQWLSLPPLEANALLQTNDIFNKLADSFQNGETFSYTDVVQSVEPLVQTVQNNRFKSILNGVKQYDNYSYVHCLRVATLLSYFAHEVGFSAEDQVTLASGGLLHDVGKMSIPHEILNKPGRLTPEERKVMESHVFATEDLLRMGVGAPSCVRDIGAQHHEKLDGSGYPRGLKAHQINDLIRMTAIVDVFSALTDRRVYKPPMSAEKALKIMTEEMATSLDQNFLRLFRDILLDAMIET